MDEGQAQGTVSGVRVHLAVSGGGTGDTSSPVTSREYLTFTVADGAGGTDVEWHPPRGRVIRRPPVDDGDQVTVRGYVRRGYLSAHVIDNHTQGTTVAGVDARAARRIGLLAVAAFVIVAGVAAVIVVLATRGAGGSTPHLPTRGPGGVGAPSSTGASPGARTVTVPDLVGDTQLTAFQALTSAGLFPHVATQQSSSVTPGTVIAVQPAAGSAVAPGSTVTLLVSCGSFAGPGCPAAPTG